ncbi:MULTISPECIES: alpha/beta hydrolase [Pseudofrankia]|uniref:alpha/beta hydrolase n=1 Tax=Pseudofrankia TaxID=2994363 RepID=UPI000234DC0E|nr:MULTISPECIES: alpha/beta hydrolase [Pseudofrankia]OHV34814.1 hypothetical protein BCD49_23050 [Pseudofrankia sp. EUN1h]
MTPARRMDLKVAVASADGGEDWRIAASVHLPAGEALAAGPPVLVLMPGGGYNRRYFDLPAPGFSQAEHHASRGTVVVAIDHLGVGESTILPAEVTTLATVAAANHAAVVTILDRMRAGSLAEGVAPFQPVAVVGAGQSLGGHALAGMQAYHRTFDGVAMLGSSMAGTTLPLRPGLTVRVPDGATAEQATLARMAGADWAWIFHWEQPSAPAGSETPDGGEHAARAALVAADVAAGVPARHTPPPWGTASYPGFSMALMAPGALAEQTALIDVPILLASGERDVCRPPAEEIAGFRAATDLSVLVVRRMAHMHNFAATRATLWGRLDEFVSHVAGGRTRRG